jgi:phosphatidylinositol-3-phosphatase
MRTRYLAAVSVGAVALALAVPPLASASGGAVSTATEHAGPAHVFVIMMENAGSDELLNPANTNTRYIQHLAATYGVATNYFGVTHPSLPNYLAATSGSTWNSNSDNTAQKTLLDHRNLVDQLEAAKVSWKGYMEGLPYPGFLGDSADYTATPHSSGNALYLLKHNPFLLYPDVYNNPGRAKKVVPLAQLAKDLADNTAPQFSWITPNICNDMHGMSGPACPYPSTGAGPSAQQYQLGDTFLHNWIDTITESRAWTKGSVIFVTWDEGGYSNVAPYSPVSTAGCCDSPIFPNPALNPVDVSGGDLTTGQVFGGGLVPMIVISAGGHRHLIDSTPANHYSLLRTVEALFHLGYLEQAGDSNQVHSLVTLIGS